jgi:protein SCO1
MLRMIRIAAWAAIAGLGLVAAMMMAGVMPGFKGGGAQAPLAATIGGPFSLTSHTGARVDSTQIKGKPFAVFFGFTYCPDVCPTTLLDLTNLIKDLGPDGDKMGFYFVTVDPERDTQSQLASYLSSFDPRITGLVGTADELAAVAKAYRAIYKRVPTKDGYTMDHTATMYLMDRNGRFAGTIDYQEAQTVALAKLKRLIASR